MLTFADWLTFSIVALFQGAVYSVQRGFWVLGIKHVVVERSQGWAVAVSVGGSKEAPLILSSSALRGICATRYCA